MNQAELIADIERYDKLFASWRKLNPDGKFSAFSLERTVRTIARGRSHATLGNNLASKKDWAEDGRSQFELLRRKFAPSAGERICDYGCGSLRVGVHLIQGQDPGCYFGIDIADDFIRDGVSRMDTDLLAAKRPVLGTIDSKIDEVSAAGIDITFSFNVAVHIHPDEQAEYNSNLKRICGKRGSRLLLHVVHHEEPVRFQRSGWAYPITQYIEWMRPLSLLEVSIAVKSVDRNGLELRVYLMTFERD